jgi:predicted NBD/HSP70 family sugar kinase
MEKSEMRTGTGPTAGDVYALIRENGSLSRGEIGALTGMSRTAVSARVSELTGRGLVVEREQAPSSGGRPATLVSLNADAGVVLTAAIGGSRARLAVCDLAGEIRAAADVDEQPGFSPDDLMPTVARRLETLLDRSGNRGARIFGIGISLPGTVDPRRGWSADSPVLTGWDRVPLHPYFTAFGGVPIVLGNDADAFALAEWRAGAARGSDDVLVIKTSTGLGAGIVSGGVLQRGALGAAGEFGHSRVASAKQRSCRCGNVGCLESVAGGWALVRDLVDAGRSPRNLREVVELAHSGDAVARRLIRQSGRHVGEVLAIAVNLLNPATLVVAGDVAGAYDIFVAGLRETLYRDATALATTSLQIVPSHFGDRAGVIGTAMMALDEVLAPSAVAALTAG